MKSKLTGLAVVAAITLSCGSVLPALADNSTLTVNPPASGLQNTGYGVFRYEDDDALIKSVKTLEQLGYKSSAPSSSLSLSVFQGGVFFLTPGAGMKPLLVGNVLGAFGFHMKHQTLSGPDTLIVRNTDLSDSKDAKVINQSYEAVVDGQRAHGSQPVMIPAGSVAVNIVKIGGDELLVIATNPAASSD